MNKPTNNMTSIEEQRLAREAAGLEPNHTPVRDLWPQIAERISTVQSTSLRRSGWQSWALAASVVVAVVSLGFNTYFLQMQTIPQQQVSNIVIEDLERPFILARAAYLEQIAVQNEQLSPELRETLETNLRLIDTAVNEIHKALEANPNDQLLIETLISTREKEIELFRQITEQRYTTI